MRQARCEMTPYYQHAGITIYHGDCRDVFKEWEGLQTQPFDLLLTDPPYGIRDKGGKWGHKADLAWDMAPVDAGALATARSLARHHIIWGGNYFSLPASRGWLAWRKPDRVPSAADFELAWTSFDMNARLITYSIAATNPERNGHPTQKPEAVMVWALTQVPTDLHAIFDPWMGSGTTLVAAKRLNRHAVGIELEERYCEIAARRLSQECLPLECVRESSI